MGFFDDLWNTGREAVASVGDVVSAGANSVGDALDMVNNVGHQYLGDAYDYIPIVSDITSIGADAAHEVGDAGALVSDVSRGKESLGGAINRAEGIGQRMVNTGIDAGIAYTAGKAGGAAGKAWGKAAAKGLTEQLGKTGGKVAGRVGREVVGAVAGKIAGDRIKQKQGRR